MGVGAGLYMYVVVVQKFTFAISSPDEFLFSQGTSLVARGLNLVHCLKFITYRASAFLYNPMNVTLHFLLISHPFPSHLLNPDRKSRKRCSSPAGLGEARPKKTRNFLCISKER